MTLNRPLGRAGILAALAILAMATCRDHREATAPGTPASADPRPPQATPTGELSPDGSSVLVGAGDIASCTTENDEATARLLDLIEGTVFTLGDNAYSTGTPTEFSTCYGPTWGRHKARTRPTSGDRDYGTAGAAGYADYFGSAAGEAGKFYYSYDVGDWHVVSLNSKLSSSETDKMLQWLKADLKANAKSCTIAYWHKPYLSSASGKDSDRKPLWEMIYAYGGEIIMSADNRYYERFGPQDANEVADPVYGLRQFIVGTGGAGSTSAPPKPRAQYHERTTGHPGGLLYK
jgi:acid phosphatase type 7